jgi:hypothetical protein
LRVFFIFLSFWIKILIIFFVIIKIFFRVKVLFLSIWNFIFFPIRILWNVKKSLFCGIIGICGIRIWLLRDRFGNVILGIWF